jgi:hypothetical protein
VSLIEEDSSLSIKSSTQSFIQLVLVEHSVVVNQVKLLKEDLLSF